MLGTTVGEVVDGLGAARTARSEENRDQCDDAPNDRAKSAPFRPSGTFPRCAEEGKKKDSSAARTGSTRRTGPIRSDA
jgi:hypothetical protein